MRIVYKAAIVAVLGAVIQTISAVAQDQPKFASDEYLLIGDTNRGAGEPQVAINPKDPNNIVVVGSGAPRFSRQLAGAHSGPGQSLTRGRHLP